MWVFTCSAVVDGVEKVFELKYDLEGCRWVLYKIQIDMNLIENHKVDEFFKKIMGSREEE